MNCAVLFFLMRVYFTDIAAAPCTLENITDTYSKI